MLLPCRRPSDRDRNAAGERRGRQILLLLVFLLAFGSGSASASGPEFPAVIEGLDFGGKTIWIYDWWHQDDEQHSGREEYPDEDTQRRYDYVDWLEETYHCTIVETALNCAYLLGSGNDVIGSVLLWGPLENNSPAEAMEIARPVWQEMLDAYHRRNGNR